MNRFRHAVIAVVAAYAATYGVLVFIEYHFIAAHQLPEDHLKFAPEAAWVFAAIHATMIFGAIAVIGFLLAVLGAAVLLQSVAMEPEGDQAVHTPFNIIDLVIAVALYAILILLSEKLGFTSEWAILGGTIIVSLLTALFRPDAKPLVLVTAATIAYGYLMKPLGLVIATAALVFISAAGGHEFKWKEVVILFIILIVFSVLVFVKGLTLPFPIWPEYFG